MTCITRLASGAFLGLLLSAAACGTTRGDDGPASNPPEPEGGLTDGGPSIGNGDGAANDGKASDGGPSVPKGKPGTLDVSFGAGGIFTFPTFGEGEIFQVLERAGGYVFAGTTHDKAGNSLQLGGVTDAGALDPAFGTAGRTIVKVGTDLRFDRAHQLVAVPGAGWLVAGKVRDEPALVRFAASGGLLTTFGTGGVAALSTNGGGEIFGTIRLADGSFVAVVKRDITLGTFEYDFRSFGATGTPGDTRSKIIASFFQQTFESKSGGIWVVGGVPAATTNGAQMFVTRYSPPGQFATFSSSPNPDYPTVTPTDGIFAGMFRTIGTVVDSGKTLMLQTSGSLGNDQLVRVDATTGAIDTSFGTSGKVDLTFPTSTSRNLLAVDAAGGSIVALGDNSTYVDSLVRFDASGKRDMSFGGTGQLAIPFSVYCARIDPSGQLVLAGAKLTSTTGGYDTAMRIARVNL